MNILREPDYFKQIIFGFEDAFVSTVGILVGIAAATADPYLIFLTGIVVIGVEALSMGVGAFLSEKASHQLQESERKGSADNPMLGGVLMFVSYILGGCVPLVPYIVLPFGLAISVSIGATFLGLFALGFIKGRLVKVNPWRSAIEMMSVAGAAIIVGYALGTVIYS